MQSILERLTEILERSGHETFIHFRDVENWKETKLSSRDIIVGALKELKNCDAILALVTSSEKSEGLLLEVGFAKALDKKIILATKKDARAVLLRDISDAIIEFENMDELEEGISKDNASFCKYGENIEKNK